MWIVSVTRIDPSLGGPCTWREMFSSKDDADLYINQHKTIYPEYDFFIWFLKQ